MIYACAVTTFSRIFPFSFFQQRSLEIRFGPPLRNDDAMFAYGWRPAFAVREWLPAGYQLYPFMLFAVFTFPAHRAYLGAMTPFPFLFFWPFPEEGQRIAEEGPAPERFSLLRGG